jgi:hypothetical protein
MEVQETIEAGNERVWVSTFPTNNLQLVHKVCLQAIIRGSIHVILGEDGLGKSTAVRVFAEGIVNDNIHVLHSRNMKYPLLIYTLANQLTGGKDEFKKSKLFDYENPVVAYFRKKLANEGRHIIIIDGFAFKNAIDALDVFKRLIESQVGIVLLGTEEDFNFLKIAGNQKSIQFDRFLHLLRDSRASVTTLSPPSTLEIKAMSGQKGICDCSTLIGCKTFTELKMKLKKLYHEQQKSDNTGTA